jgi:DNA repair protein RecO (recombination protein O)
MPDRQRSLRVEAIVLRHSDWGEADRLLGLFTRELGKVRAIAKWVRKARSRKAGHLEPFTQVSLLLARGRDTLIVTQAEAVDAHLALREDLVRVGYAAYVIELLDRFTYEEGENTALYRLLAELGGTLCPNCGPGVPGSRPVSVGALRVLRHLQRSSYAEAHRLPLSPTVDRELESLMQHYLTYILERGLNTPAFLRRVRSTAHLADTELNE